jgi:hypothetical protein
MIPVLEITNGEKESDESESDETESDTKGKIALSGVAVIKNYQLAGYLNGVETRGFQWVNGNCMDAEICAFDSGAWMPMRVLNSKSKVKFSEEENHLTCDIFVDVIGAADKIIQTVNLLPENLAPGKLPSDNEPDIYEHLFSQVITEEILQTVNVLQRDLRTDVYQFKEYLRKHENTLYQRCGENWEQSFENMKIVPHVSVRIKSQAL